MKIHLIIHWNDLHFYRVKHSSSNQSNSSHKSYLEENEYAISKVLEWFLHLREENHCTTANKYCAYYSIGKS